MTGDALQSDTSARARIRELLDDTLFVEASAGTGKTAALVDRYLALVLAGRTVDRIVAITFTEKAAAELRDRVRAGLDARLAAETDPERRRRVDGALAGLDRAHISTIHAFCQSLLRFFAVLAGIDPAFEVQDEVAAQRRFEERWRTCLDGLGANPDAVDAVGRLLDLGMTPRILEELAQALWRRGELAEQLDHEPLTTPPAPPPAPWPDLAAMRDQLMAIPTATVPGDDRLLPRIQETLTLLDDLLSAGDQREAILVAASLNPRLGNTGNTGNWKGSIPVAEAREITIGVIQTLIDTLESVRSAALARVMPFVVRFVLDEAHARGRDGALMFDDLILKVRNVLRDIPDAKVRFRNQYDALLIDEFQDTDPLQADIALAFATDPSTGLPEPGRLFLVGDPKQSIYRFRRADMAMYAQTRNALRESGSVSLDLSLNRRSQPAVIDWVNQVFQAVIGPGLIESVQSAYKPLDPHRDESLTGPGVACFGYEADEPAALMRHREAQYIAAYCRDALHRQWQVYDRATEGIRTARYRDIAVLLPARTILQPLERALANEGIPYRVEGGSLVYATQEVRDLINCLSAIDDPSDDVAVVAALRSPAYACSDPEIAAYRLQQGGSFNYLWPDLNTRHDRVAGSLRDLRNWHERRSAYSIAALVDAFINDRRLVEIGLLDSGNRNAFRRARFLVEQARAFESAGPETLRAFVEWLERRAGDAIYDHEGAALDDDEDAVRVLTIHAAKGLEFPIVFLAGLGTAPFSPPPIFGQERGDGRIAVQAGRVNTRFNLGDVDEVMRNVVDHESAERNRLLYVGATRARDHLIVSLFHKKGSRETYAQRLIAARAGELAQPLPPVSIAEQRSTATFEGVQVDTEDEEGFEDRREALIAAAHTRHFTSATALARDTEPEDEKEEREDETEPWSKGRAGTHLGRAVHAALQSLPWDADDEAIAAVATAQVVAEAIPDRRDEAARLIHVALNSPAAQRARTARRALREVPFAFKDETASPPVIVEGFADLVIENEDGIEIVDWKTDTVPESGVEERLKKYRTQAGLYVLGLEKALEATGKKVTAISYVFVSPNQERSPGDPAELAAASLQRLRGP
ncbi:MAG TPA: UvrD-helicase domain-containing protein [Dehalococcoidia bacterium]|nr:UvrD-helicase domain-containing protein [Dehalococcoidia bacterium]